MDPIERFKEQAKKTWPSFHAMEMQTAGAAPRLVRFAGIGRGANVLDVGCGTGVVALTAARVGAEVTGVDLTPELVERAKNNAALMGFPARFVEGDVEALPFPDAAFDVVVSQFGHIFAPRPELAVKEMLRVLKPGGTIAFSSWPPELYLGRFLALTASYSPIPPPEGMSPPPLWGDPRIVRERLGSAVKDLVFDRDVLRIPILSPQHLRVFGEKNLGPLSALTAKLEEQDPAKLELLRRELEALAGLYFEDNHLRQDYLLTRARKA
ncbi:class I SAM-dependent methyltransferase [Vulgatibacter incomptus]|uniref:Ubiquinone/menaquinone biosynthesis methyltransferase UbiE n=1 Tax=Vulgatibacter incomptus TaxID=1391653 RepID=A0A0K1P9H4_9BACT|nr:class I SAM-dependent methyltransferase [Vulgatibacter incomptus]AKU90162.1 Ubiquinone/menaquinone biosynthesis methyltransferase UbiE [Vulgatibacter incomptus]